MRIHFIAIGGSAMHNLALALAAKGHTLSGSDDAVFEPSRSRLERAGILPPAEGWFEQKITKDLDAIILGMHAREDNPELKKAQELGLKIYSYPEFLYEESKNKIRMVVGGSHGKTTITSMILHAMKVCGVKADYMVGALLEGFERMVELTKESKYMVIEGDEYLSSPLDMRSKFLHYFPNVALISGIAWDHMNVFPTYESYTDTFEKFINSIRKGGSLIYNAQDPEVVRIIEKVRMKSDPDIEYIPYRIPSYFIQNERVVLQADRDYFLKIFGRHNLSNMEGARLVCEKTGIAAPDFYRAMETFPGASRRLEKMHEDKNVVIFRDFAHAPSKVRASVDAVKELYPDKRVVAALELHTYSSLSKEFLPQYAGTLDRADVPLVYYSKEAMELKRMPELDPKWVKGQFANPSVKVSEDSASLLKRVKAVPKKGTVYLFMSSGNWDKIDFVSLLSK